ncbi:MAG: hypothetical protein Q7R41_17080 [Phycisphaerales bacterium]|nr:hypothetical protein [Phycisphaerales bacterium]
MSVPNLQSIVFQVRGSQPWPFRSKAQLCAYSHAVIVALHQVDARFGKLKKIQAQNHCVDPSGALGAVDVALFQPTGQIVDFISSAGFEPDTNKPEPTNAVTWTVGPEGEYTAADWFAPGGAIPPVPDPPPGPTPPDPLEPRIVALELLFSEILQQIGALNRQLADLDAAVVRKPLPGYVGSGRVGFWGGSFIITSRPSYD